MKYDFTAIEQKWQAKWLARSEIGFLGEDRGPDLLVRPFPWAGSFGTC